VAWIRFTAENASDVNDESRFRLSGKGLKAFSDEVDPVRRRKCLGHEGESGFCESGNVSRASFPGLQLRGGGLGFFAPQTAGPHPAAQAKSAGQEGNPEPEKRDHDR
jgi:hypothetical protein